MTDTVRDSNGNELKDGDNVTLIKDLKVKGANVTLKRGTMIKGIRLTGNTEEVDCRHEKVKGLGAADGVFEEGLRSVTCHHYLTLRCIAQQCLEGCAHAQNLRPMLRASCAAKHLSMKAEWNISPLSPKMVRHHCWLKTGSAGQARRWRACIYFVARRLHHSFRRNAKLLVQDFRRCRSAEAVHADKLAIVADEFFPAGFHAGFNCDADFFGAHDSLAL